MSFFAQWLHMEDFDTTARDPKLFPQFTPQLRAAMREQVLRQIDTVMYQGDGSLADLFTSRQAPVNGPLYEFLGLPDPASQAADAWQTVELPSEQRSGLLTLPAMMTIGNHPDQTSLVRRGVFVLEQLLCTTPPPPPPDVDSDPPVVDPNATTRERFEQHRKEPSCAGCHAAIDPFGVPFESFDPIGRFRTLDAGRPINPNSEITGTDDLDGTVGGALELVDKLAASPSVSRCFAEQWLRYAVGRSVEPEEAGNLDKIHHAFVSEGSRLEPLMKAIVASVSFRYRKPLRLEDGQ